MKITIYIIFIAIILFNSCDKPPDYSTELRFPEFFNVTVKNATNVEINYGKEQKVIIEGDEADVKNIISEVKSNTLIIDMFSTEKNSLNYIITLPIIREVKNETNATILISDFEQTGFLNIFSTNNGIVDLGKFNNLELLNIDLANTSTVNGYFPFNNLIDLNIKLEDDAAYIAYPIVTQNAIIELNGEGSCYLSVSKSLTAKINGNGTIYYKGKPKVYSNNIGSEQVVQVD